jgi:hypothetical protein
MRRLPLLAGAILAILLLAGCEASVSTSGIDSEEVAESAQAELTKSSEARGGPPYPEVECPDQLEEEKGDTMTCFAEFDGERHEVSVEVTSVEDGHGNLHFEGDLPAR